MYKIKKIIRDILETNSSSTHCLVISEDLLNKDKKSSQLNIFLDNFLGNDGKLHLRILDDNLDSFGWNWESTNSVMVKYQYALSLLLQQSNYLYDWTDKPEDSYRSNEDFMNGFTKEIMESFGVYIEKFTNYPVVLDFLIEYFEKLREEDPISLDRAKESVYLSFPEVDHQSIEDQYSLIYQNYKSFINFIFDENSWLFLGNDNSIEPKDFYNPTKEVTRENPSVKIASINFGDPIGRVDFYINSWPPLEKTLFNLWENIHDFLDGIVLDKNKKIIPVKPFTNNNFSKISTIMNDYEYSLFSSYGSSSLFNIGGDLYIIFLRNSIDLFKLLHDKFGENINYSEKIEKIKQILINDFVDGRDYIKYKIEFK